MTCEKIGICTIPIFMKNLITANSILINEERPETGSRANKIFKIHISSAEFLTVNESHLGCWGCACCKTLRLKIADLDGGGVLEIIGRLSYFHKSVDVYGPTSNMLGNVKQKWNPIRTILTISKSNGEMLYRIKGPSCLVECTYPVVEYQVLSANGEDVGKIVKEWTGYVRERIHNRHTYSILFPNGVEVEIKFLLIAAGFLIVCTTLIMQRNNYYYYRTL